MMNELCRALMTGHLGTLIIALSIIAVVNEAHNKPSVTQSGHGMRTQKWIGYGGWHGE
jgi:hypothetical protein